MMLKTDLLDNIGSSNNTYLEVIKSFEDLFTVIKDIKDRDIKKENYVNFNKNYLESSKKNILNKTNSVTKNSLVIDYSDNKEIYFNIIGSEGNYKLNISANTEDKSIIVYDRKGIVLTIKNIDREEDIELYSYGESDEFLVAVFETLIDLIKASYDTINLFLQYIDRDRIESFKSCKLI